MSRYKKVVFGESELKEIKGIKFLIYPTLETRMKMLDIFKDAQRSIETVEKVVEDGVEKDIKKIVKGDFDVHRMKNVCSEIIFEACFEHDGTGKRIKVKPEEEGISFKDIEFNVMNSGIFDVYMEIASEIGVLSKNDKKEIEEDLKKKSESSQEKSLLKEEKGK